MRDEQKKNFHMLDKNIVDTFNNFKDDRSLHAQIIGQSEEPKERNNSVVYKINVR